MNSDLAAVLILFAVLVLDVAALRFGVDSRQSVWLEARRDI